MSSYEGSCVNILVDYRRTMLMCGIINPVTRREQWSHIVLLANKTLIASRKSFAWCAVMLGGILRLEGPQAEFSKLPSFLLKVYFNLKLTHG